MSKSYFERRILGQNGPDDSTDDQTPNLGSLKTAGAPTPSQPYRFRASRAEQPATLTSRPDERDSGRESYSQGQSQGQSHSQSQSGQGWDASAELRRRLHPSGETAPAEPLSYEAQEAQHPASQTASHPASHWGPQTAQTAQTAQPAQPADLDPADLDPAAGYGDEHLLDQLTGHSSGETYPFDAPQTAAASEEPTFGFHSSEEFDHHEQAADASYQEQTMRAASVATTATHAEYQGAAPEAAVTEPRVASTAGVRVGQRVNLSDQRSGSSVQPNLYVSADDRIGSASQTRKPRGPFAKIMGGDAKAGGGNPLARAKAQRNGKARAGASASASGPQGQRPQGKGFKSPVGVMQPRRLSTAPRQARRNRDGGGVFGWFRKGALTLAMLFTLGVVMSVSYAGLQRLGNTQQAEAPLLLAPDTPIKLTPEEAGLSADVAAGRRFEGDLTVLSDPQGVVMPSDERFAADAQEAPTMVMNFGGQSIIVPQVDATQPAATVIDPMANIIEASSNVEPLASPVAGDPAALSPAAEQALTDATIPAVAEEPLAAKPPLADGLRGLPRPQLRGAVPSTYKGLAQANPASTAPSANTGASAAAAATALTATPTLAATGTQTAMVSGQRGAASPSAILDPASGLPTTPQAPSGLSGAAVVSPFGIQLASLRTEQQATVLWTRLQEKYPSLLGGLASRVVRFDSGSRGVFYRLQAGPMPTKATALDFCIKLKSAGQECIFVRGS